ncbi:hypothetical protein HPB49_019541 [Dermacentor silvarum]|uniref:Uncharacterized protein n=1 Tax=Dermacentor silvarum TaxID=543639 RepID=A0ACB8DFN9_DERSI|nr:hypothetical protein HPB49_019541 [Dermacentor silvarum]
MRRWCRLVVEQLGAKIHLQYGLESYCGDGDSNIDNIERAGRLRYTSESLIGAQCLCIIVIYVCLATSHQPKSAKASRPPNIIFILVDDLGWNDVSFHGSRQIPTPNIDALAASGIILQRHYTSPDCTPSRTALLTARYPSRTDVGYEVFPPAAENALSLRFELMPQWLQRLGYTTHMVGKWHVGYKSLEHTPTWRGFDTFFGYYNSDIFYFNHTLRSAEHINRLGGKSTLFFFLFSAKPVEPGSDGKERGG